MRSVLPLLVAALLLDSCKRVDPRAVCVDGGGQYQSVAHFVRCCYATPRATCPEALPVRGAEDGCCHTREWSG